MYSLRIGDMNVGELLPDNLLHLAQMYQARSTLLPAKYAYVPRNTDPTFVQFMREHTGTICLSGLQGLLAKAILPKFRYVPRSAKLALLRNKAVSTGLVLNQQLRLQVVPGTEIVERQDFVQVVLQMVQEHGTVFVRLGEHADGGYMSEVIHHGTTIAQLESYLEQSACNVYVCAPFVRHIVADPGVGFTPRHVFAPNYNLSFMREHEQIGTVGVALPYLGCASWIPALMEVGEMAREYIRRFAGWFEFCNVDTMVLPDGSLYFCEFNPRYTMTRLVVSGLWKTAWYKGTTRLKLNDYHAQMASGALNTAFIACDKLATEQTSTWEVEQRLRSVGINPFDGRSGFLPTHPWVKPDHGLTGYYGLIIVAHSDWGATHAMHQVVDMYRRAQDVLGVPYHGELTEIVEHI